jgi:branched-chain amino acid transport system ATP-binding protein
MPLLQVVDLEVRYGHIYGTSGVSFSVEAGETLALVGSNGAGKSSTLKAILGMVSFPKGDVRWEGASLKGLKPFEAMRRGIAYSPEGRRVFPALSVHENLWVGGYTRTADEFAQRIEQIHAYFPKLKERRKQSAGSLSGGEQQMLAIGRALMSYPKLLLLDEPSLGLAPIIVEHIGEMLLEVQAKEKLAIVLSEQNALWALEIASRAVLLELGKTVAHGSADELRRTPKIRDAYFGAEIAA